jgi:hypothetical protein
MHQRDSSGQAWRGSLPWEDHSVNEEQTQHLRKLAQTWRDHAQWIRDQPNGQETDRRAAATMLDFCASQLDEWLDRPA